LRGGGGYVAEGFGGVVGGDGGRIIGVAHHPCG
jgi:hypothetical protein